MKLVNVLIGVLLFALIAVGCKNTGQQKTAVHPITMQDSTGKVTGPVIVFINIDSLETKYQFFLDAKKRLDDRGRSIEADLESRGRQLQQKMEGYQAKAQDMTPKELEAAQAEMGKQQNELMRHKEDVEKSLSKDLDELNKQYKKKLQDHLAQISKENHYSYILTANSAFSGMLYGDPALDITESVVTALNEQYKQEKK